MSATFHELAVPVPDASALARVDGGRAQVRSYLVENDAIVTRSERADFVGDALPTANSLR